MVMFMVTFGVMVMDSKLLGSIHPNTNPNFTNTKLTLTLI